MKGKALGMGLNVLIPDKSDNLEVITPKSEVLSSNIENENVDVKSSNLEGTSYNLEVLRQSISEAGKNPRISLWSPLSTAVLRYLRNTKQAFSISEEASELLEEVIIRKYPELAERINAEMSKGD